MAINYDPAALGGAAFGNQDWDHLKSQGHSDSEINSFIGGLDTTQVSNKYKDRGGHEENDDSWKHYDDSWTGFVAAPEPTKAQRDAKAKADKYAADQAKAAKEKADRDAAAKVKHDADQAYIGGLAAGKKGPGGGIDYDPAAHGGAAFGNLDYEHLKSQGHSDTEINSYLGTLDNSQVSNKYKPQGGHERTEDQQQRFDAGGSTVGRLSSDGLYQDRYSVGKTGADDEGDTYLSQGSLGSIDSYFRGWKNNEKDFLSNFDDSYDSWTHTGRGEGEGGHGGYAGDVLKYLDSSGLGKQISDEQYNKVVNDAKNHNWESQMASDGTQSGRSHANFDASGTYDARIGGSMQSQGNMNDETAKLYADWTNPEYYSGSSVAARNARKTQTNIAAEKVGLNKPFEMEAYKPEGFKYDPWGTSNNEDSGSGAYKPVKPEDVKPITTNQDPASSGTSLNTSSMFGQFNPNYKTGYQGIDINDLSASYAKMGFNFDPMRFNTQGQ